MSQRLTQLYGTIVINFCNNEWTLPGVVTVFTVRVMADHGLIANLVCVGSTFLVFPSIILLDKALLPFGNISPVGGKRDWQEGVTTKHELRRSGVHCGVNRRVDRFGNRREVSSDFLVVFIRFLSMHLQGAKVVVHGLVDAFHNRVCLGITGEDK